VSQTDDLFGSEDAPVPRVGVIVTLLASGMLLAFLGLACSSIPGGVLILLAWLSVEKELDRVDSGYLPESERPRVKRWRKAVIAGLWLVLGLVAIQAFLLCLTDVYEVWLLENLEALMLWRTSA
jgi:hypothetical protein